MRHRRTIALFLLCAAAVFGAMSWLTFELRALERHQAEMNARAENELAFQTSIRTALWRIESRLAAFLAQEAARPYFHYSAFYSPDAAYVDADLTMACKGDVIEPSPLLMVEPEFCRLHFQIKSDEILSTPRVPTDPQKLAEAEHRYDVTWADIALARSLLEELRQLATPGELRYIGESLPGTLEDADAALAWSQTDAGTGARTSPQVLAQREYVQRQQTAQAALNVQQTYSAWTKSTEGRVTTGPLRAIWRSGLSGREDDQELLLLRKAQAGSEWFVQGIWVDWPVLRASLLARVENELPGADLIPGSYTKERPELQLAGIPAVLDPGQSPAPSLGVQPAVRREIYIAWVSAAVAILALGAALLAILELGERRGRFVSAVTHELRTPLTTFCLYSQMLADGMVKDESARREYFGTLKRESQRLARIVENVLCYARLAEVRSALHKESLDAGALLDRLTPALARRSAEAGMELQADTAAVRGHAIDVDAQTVERILMNLVDNACKYGGPDSGGDSRIRLSAHPGTGVVEIRVADRGPGIPRSQRRRVFRAFSRTAAARESAAPGLGLGLSLARGLSRELGGDLSVATPEDGRGAVLALTIPCRGIEPVASLARA
jgi:signal transduction histidine kinase